MSVHESVKCCSVLWHTLYCRGDCTHFGLPNPELPQLGQFQEEIDSYDRMWALYGRFYSGLGELTQQDWLSFRCASACLYACCCF